MNDTTFESHCVLPYAGEVDHFDILTALMPIVGSWKAIGRGLRIDSGRLDMVQKRQFWGFQRVLVRNTYLLAEKKL